MAYEEGSTLSSPIDGPSYDDPDTLLAGLAQEALAWATALDTARQQLPGAVSPAVERTPGVNPAPTDVITGMLSQAKGDVMLVDPGGDANWRWPADLASQMGAAADRGCRVRVLFGLPVEADARNVAEHVNASDGGEIRIGRTPDQAMLTVDAVALLPPEVDAPAATAITQPNLVRLLSGFANMAWAGGEPLRRRAVVDCFAQQPVTGSVNRQVHRRILQLLAGGAKDETIARLLGMSVRTCRRHIAEIMAKLDAVSRFQAGANAARLGLPDTVAGVLVHP